MGLEADIPEALTRALTELTKQHAELSRQLEDPAVVTDHKLVRTLSVRRAGLDEVVSRWGEYRRLVAEIAEYQQVLGTGADADLVALAREELPRAREHAGELLAQLQASLVNSGDDAIGSIILELRAGTGGDEAGLWTRDLLEMYTRYAARRGWSVEPLDMGYDTGVGGLRSATLNVRGPGVWSVMNFEAGVHSVKRVPATEAAGRIHTSTATVAVLPEPDEVDVKIDWTKDVQEFATTSQGPGGQNVNKVATAWQVKHLATGLLVRCQESKSQSDNKQRARRLLLTKLHELERQRLAADRSAARTAQIGGGERSEKVRTYRYKEGIVADERLPGEYALRDLLSGDFDELHRALLERQTHERLARL